MQKRIIHIGIIILLVSCMVMMLVGCSQGNSQDSEDIEGAIVSGDWVYRLDIDKNVATIIGPTREARQKENLILPRAVDGIKVVGVGIEYPGRGMAAPREAFHFKTEKTRKILVPWDIGEVDKNNIFRSNDYTEDNYATSSSIKPKIVIMRFGEESRRYVTGNYPHLIDENQFRLFNFNDNGRDVQPNIVFYYNYEGASNNGIYWADDNELDEEIVLPENPVREGYTFDGWYSDESCTVEFNQTKYIVENVNIKIYAKWTKE